MKKIILAITALFAVLGLASCAISADTSIRFTKLPKAIYVMSDNPDVEKLRSEIEVSTGTGTDPLNLNNPGLTVTGFDENTLSTPGSYTLVVTFGTLSVSYNYTVVAGTKPVSINSAEELVNAGKTGGVYQLSNDIELTELKTETEYTKTYLPVSNNLTIYGNGHKIYAKNTEDRVKLMNVFVAGVNVKLYDITLEGGNRAFQIQASDVSVEFDNVTVICGKYAFNVSAPDNSTNINVKIYNSKITGWAAINCYCTYSTFMVENSTLEGINNAGAGPSNRFAVIVIDGGGYDDEIGNSNGLLVGEAGIGNKFEFSNTTIKAKSEKNHEWALSLQYGAMLNEVRFNECTFEFTGDCYRNEQFIINGINNKVYVDGNIVK